MKREKASALALFSGGLDSILSCRLVMEQGIRVQALRFVTPFFGYGLLAREEEYRREVRDKYGIDVHLKDVSELYLKLLRKPVHGYGKNFNPCLDCKILLVSEARRLLSEYGASFIITGEVVGQRPMSQRRDTLRVIERDSGTAGILVRPLCAQNLDPTPAEVEGLVDRNRLLNFGGRGRSDQIRLAEKFGIRDYPNAGGGCVLTDVNLGKRIERFYKENEEVSVNDALLLQTGRHFVLPAGGWFVVGRSEKENDYVSSLAGPDDLLLKMDERPGPTGLLRFSRDPADMKIAASLVVRYGRKVKDGPREIVVHINGPEGMSEVVTGPIEHDKVLEEWIR